MTKKITKRVVDSAAPDKKDTFIWDTDLKGFGLKVTPAGRRIYVLQYRINGRLRRYTIGCHGSPWTPHAARTEASRLAGLVASNTDPMEVRADKDGDRTVNQACDEYLSTAEQNRSKGRRKTGPFSVMRYAVLRVVPLVHRRAPRCFA